MDNFRFNIIADSESTFKNAMAIAMSQHSKAVGYELKECFGEIKTERGTLVQTNLFDK